MTRFAPVFLVSILAACASSSPPSAASQTNAAPAPAAKGTPAPATRNATDLRLGNFSVSLAVKDIAASRAFYEKLGFHAVAGNARNFIIMQNETSTIGLFHGMFEKNILTFNPGWDRTTATLKDFDDVRDIQKTLKQRGFAITAPADESSSGPASFVLFDPDGNQIVIDQHVPKPVK
jgi:catechol 2,3-dioxygenase-like lactoylglutathione lyase family enzyme